MIKPIFYRDRAAYIIGRIRIGSKIIPLVIALLNSRNGAFADAVLLSRVEISILFSFTRSYFHVLVDNPSEMVNFLMTINLAKRASEIYSSIILKQPIVSVSEKAMAWYFAMTAPVDLWMPRNSIT